MRLFVFNVFWNSASSNIKLMFNVATSPFEENWSINQISINLNKQTRNVFPKGSLNNDNKIDITLSTNIVI